MDNKLSKLSRKLIFALVAALALVFQLVLPSSVYAAASYAINATTAVTPLHLNLTGTASGNPYAGQRTAHHVSVYWGDTQSDRGLNLTFTTYSDSNPKFFNATWSASHAYSAPGSYTVTMILYHAQESGHESADSTMTVTVVIPPAQINVIKHVINDNGGTKTAADFTLNVTGTNVSPSSFSGSETGTAVSLNAGSYSVDETVVTGYTKTLSANCSGTIASGQTKTCTITNDDNPPVTTGTLTVTKVVINDNGGTKQVADFPLSVNQTGVTSGQANTFVAGIYTVSETNSSGYTATFGGDCDQSGSITVVAGQSKSCTVTNNDIQPKLTVVKVVINDNGGTKQVADFPLSVNQTSVTSGVTNGFNAGIYTASETNSPGYAATFSGDCNAQGQVTLAVGDTKICTITNNDVEPKLTVTKVVVNDNGGTAKVGDFTLMVGDTQVVSGLQAGINAGTYTVSESGPSGYSAVFSGDCSGNSTITLNLGDVKSCTITNDDIAPKLTVTKVVVNNDGGSLGVNDFTLRVDGSQVVSGEQQILLAGIHTVSEDNPAPGYVGTISGDCTADGFVTLAPGDVKSCTITNDDVAPGLTVIKQVINDNGGTAVVGSFTLRVDGNQVTSGQSTTLSAGAHVVSEDNPGSSYVGTISGDCDVNGNITLNPGDTKVCTITNDDVQPQLTVTKVVTNDNGGAAKVSDFTLKVNGTTVTSGQANGFDAGSYTVSENGGPTGYTATFSGDCNVEGGITMVVGKSYNCTLTNDDVQPKITVTKVVINDSGTGTAQVADFTLKVGEVQVTSGVQAGVNAGTYTVSETGPSGYTASFTGDCGSDGALTLNPGEVKTCTITNNDNPPTSGILKIIKQVVGSEVSPATFSFSVNGGTAQSFNQNGENDLTEPAGVYTVTEPAAAGYNTTYDNCTEVQVPAGSSVTCTITNTFVSHQASSDVSVTKTVSNSSPHQGDQVTYTLTAANVGPDAATGVSVTDVLPVGVTYVSDDGAGAYSSSTGIWTIGQLSNGASVTLHIVVTVNSSAGSTITNSASVTATQADPSTGNNTVNQGLTVASTGGGGGGGGGGGLICTTYDTNSLAMTISGDVNSSVVTLNFVYSSTVTGIAISNTPDFSGINFETPTPSRSWTLASSSGTRIVYVKFREQNGCTTDRNVTFGTGGVPTVLGEATGPQNQGRVLGAETCSKYLSSYIKYGRKNIVAEVKKLQTFLNETLGINLVVNGIYNKVTRDAVNKFQLMYSEEILKPWVTHGLTNDKTPTGHVYKTTSRWINMLKCPSLNLPIPQLP